jgi:hypothetical protein
MWSGGTNPCSFKPWYYTEAALPLVNAALPLVKELYEVI